ncbi:MAG: NUDIX domain-containing protein [Nocardiopsaceae bacterium]|nr:NUDIX domain-containing protein [Nocardiopsaceae bacterium]
MGSSPCSRFLLPAAAQPIVPCPGGGRTPPPGGGPRRGYLSVPSGGRCPPPRARIVLGGRAAADGEELSYSSRGQRWAVSWHSPARVPAGRPHGANAFCVTGDGRVVLISPDGRRWGWPGGRPEAGEDWLQTLRRELLEEACAEVEQARLLGFTRSACLAG